ncbi:hypothetical protein RAG50_26645 [Klebsiella pneumoniae]
MNEVGRHVREQYADTAGFTDHLSEPVACSATISFCESGICHRSGCTYLIPIRPPWSYASW